MVGVSILSFLLIAISNTDPAEVIARRSAGGAFDEMVESVRVQLGQDKPLMIRYANWLGGLFTGNLGTSIFSFRPINCDLSNFFPTTLRLVGLSLVWVIVISVPVSAFIRLFRSSLLSELNSDYVAYVEKAISSSGTMDAHLRRTM